MDEDWKGELRRLGGLYLYEKSDWPGGDRQREVGSLRGLKRRRRCTLRGHTHVRRRATTAEARATDSVTAPSHARTRRINGRLTRDSGAAIPSCGQAHTGR